MSAQPDVQPLYRSPLGLYGFQADDIAKGYLMESGMVCWDTGTGKQAPVSEPVLTPGGWRTMGDLRPGDEVFGVDGQPATVLSVHPQETRETFRVTFSDGSWTRCGPDHLWTVLRRTNGARRADGGRQSRWLEETLTTRELRDRPGLRRRRIPLAAPIQYPEADLPIDPYALGVLLGDAYINPAGVVWLTTDKEIIDTLGVEHGHCSHKSPGIAVLTTRQWQEGLVGLGLAGCHSQDKFVPEVYLRAPEAARRALLAGLLDSDGYPDKTGVEFCSTSRQLIDAVVELTQSLGGLASAPSSRFTTYTYRGERRVGQESWRTYLRFPEQPFRLARKMVRWRQSSRPLHRYFASIEPDEPEDAVCIRVDREDGLYLTRNHIVTHNTHFAMCLSAMLFEDDEIDLVLLVAEKGKIREWVDDYSSFTGLVPHLHHGPGRMKRLEKADPQVLVSTYETIKADAAKSIAVPGRRGRHLEDGPLLEWLGDRRVLVVYDEVTKIKNRASANHKTHAHLLKHLRAKQQTRVWGLTATPIERDWEDAYNQFRILVPDAMPLIKDFERRYVRNRDPFGRPRWHTERMPEFAALCQPHILRRRKTDPELIEQFPRQVEEAHHVEMGDAQREFYALVEDVGFPDDEDEPTPGLWTVMRQIAGHPASLVHSAANPDGSALAKILVEELGADYIRSIPSAKTEALLEYVEPIIKGQGDKVVVFTFFGQSVLPLLEQALRAKGIPVWINHGQMNEAQQTRSRQDFRQSPVPGVFLTSDAGARGINLPEATYVVEYESALTFANRTQRINRIHRIDSTAALVTAMTLILDGTVEETIADTMIGRNVQHETLLDADAGEGHFTADQRREALRIGRRRPRRR